MLLTDLPLRPAAQRLVQPPAPEMNLLREIITARPATVLQPYAFFVAHSGVLTLVYTGFSRTILEIKAALESHVPDLQAENAGSQWAKTTLGALRNDKALTERDVYFLRELCDTWNQAIAADRSVLPVTALSLVLFVNRSLEQRLFTEPIPLKQPGRLPDPPPEAHRKDVEQILDQFAQPGLLTYLPRILHGQRRIRHYRITHPEATLIYDLPERQPAYIDGFVEAVERYLPGYYAWFSPTSRHVTVRALSYLN